MSKEYKSKSTQQQNRKEEKRHHEDRPNKYFNHEVEQDPLKKFYEQLVEKKAKRALRELKNPYDW
jgi:hypothetical protein